MKRFLTLLFSFAVCFMAAAELADEKHSYTSGFSTVLKIGKALNESLAVKAREQIHPQPVTLDLWDMPTVRPADLFEDGRPFGQVLISAGFIDLINHVSHAKAIDKIERGYFQKYILSLAEESGERELKELPNISNPRFWNDDVMNAQLSSFNQMAGMIVAINLSHHYLGHYRKYSSQLGVPHKYPVSINDLLTPAEWEQSVKTGAHNALDCALATDGLRALFEAIDQMPKRPAWTAYFLPKNADVKRLNKELQKHETDFFHGKLK